MSLDASVIVPSYNSMATIVPCLEALRAQNTRRGYEVLLVDSSDDGTGDLVASRFPEVRLIRLEGRTLPGPARNLGIEAARGELLAFTDADCVPDPDWLDRMLSGHAREPCGALGGSVLNGLPRNPVAWCGYLLEFNERLPSLPRRYVDLLPTCNVSFKRAVFEKHGLFPVDLWPSEDHIFCWRLVTAGERLLFDPGIRVRHLFRPRLRSYLNHQVRLGRASADARRQVDLPQAWLSGHPLRWIAPFLRWLRIEGRLARYDLPNFLRFNLLAPLAAAGLFAWGVGFARAPEEPSVAPERSGAPAG